MIQIIDRTDRIIAAENVLGRTILEKLLAEKALPSIDDTFISAEQLKLLQHGYAEFCGSKVAWTPMAELLFLDLKEPRWTTKDGRRLRLEDMGDSHLLNALLLVCRQIVPGSLKNSSSPDASAAEWAQRLSKEAHRRNLRAKQGKLVTSASELKECLDEHAQSVLDRKDQPTPCQRAYTHSLEPLTLRPGEVVTLINPGSPDLGYVLSFGLVAVRAHFTADNVVFVEVVYKNADGTLTWLSPSVLMKQEMLKRLLPHAKLGENGQPAVGVTDWFSFSIGLPPRGGAQGGC